MLNETYRAMLGHKSVIRETFMYGKQRAAEIATRTRGWPRCAISSRSRTRDTAVW